jgi:TolA-binding protein
VANAYHLTHCWGRSIRLLIGSWAIATSGTAWARQDEKPAPPAPRVVPADLRFANDLLRDRRYDLAASQYERFLKSEPTGVDAAEAHFGWGRAKLFLNDYAAARREFETYLKLAPNGPNAATAAFRAGEAAYLMNDLAAARKALEAYTDRFPDHAHRDTAWPELGDTCFKLNDLPAAKQAYQKAIELEPNGRLANRSRFHLGRTLAALHEVDEAVKVFAALAEANDAEWSGKARMQEALALLNSGKPAEAAERFEIIEKLKPAGVAPGEARLRRAEALIKADKREDAETILAALVKEGSKAVAPPSAFALAGSQIDSGKLAEARATCDAVIALVPDSPWVPRLLYRSAEAFAKETNSAEARKRFLKVAADYPKDAWAPSALLRAGRIALDSADFAVALSIATEFPSRFPSSAMKGDARLLAARASLALDRPKEAVAGLEALIAEEKPGSELAQSARYYLGVAYKADGQSEKAAKMLGDLAKSSDAPASADAKLVVGFELFEAKKFEEAATALQGYLDARPKGDDAPRALAYLALARQELGQADAAKEALDRLATNWPKSDALPRARLILAESAFEAKRYAEAEALFKPVAESDEPKWKVRALSGLAWSQLQGGHPDEAAKSFATILSVAPADPLAADAALGRAKALEAAGQNEPAIAALAVVINDYAKSPQVPSARLARARLLGKTGKTTEAADEFRALLQAPASKDPEAPTAADLLVEWGWLLHDSGKVAEADEAFRKLLDEHPDSPRAVDARVFMAESLFAAGKTEDAAKLLAPLTLPGVKGDPVLLQTALLRLGRIELARGDAPQAEARFDRLLKDYPDGKFRIEAQMGKADAALKAGKPDAAELLFATIAKETGPEAAQWVLLARVRRVQTLVALEKWTEALSETDRLKAEGVALNPSQLAEVEYARGRALAAEARFDDARAAYQAAIDAWPKSEPAARSQLMRGETFFHQKNYEEALREFHNTDLSYKAPEWQAAALFEAGKVYEILKRWTDAVDVYQKIQKNFPKDSRIAEVEKRLNEAKKNVSAPAPPIEEPPADKPPGGV